MIKTKNTIYFAEVTIPDNENFACVDKNKNSVKESQLLAKTEDEKNGKRYIKRNFSVKIKRKVNIIKLKNVKLHFILLIRSFLK